MKQTNTITALLFLLVLLTVPVFSQNEVFTMRQVKCAMSQPWEVTYGPDNHLWVTEAESYRILRIDPVDGSSEVLVDLSDHKNFPNGATPWPQGGLMGLVLHPDLLNGKPWVYAAYVHQFDSCKTGNEGCFFRTKVVRFTYNSTSHTLTNEVALCDTIPGSTDHNGGRLAIGPVGGTPYLFYSVGDMGAGHLGNGDRQHHGQEVEKYEGKILRFNLVADGDAGMLDRWIPNDNPFGTADVQSAVWSLGHRNPQGLVVGPTGILYEAEHGPYSDDEVNVIVPGVNYGFPLIAGFADGNYNGSAVGAGSGVPLITSEQANKIAIEAAFPYKDPLKSFFPVSQAEVSEIYTNDVNNTDPYPFYFLSWPTIAPSGMDIYTSNAIPGWQNSLLVTSLKLGRVYRLKLSADGQTIVGDTIPYFTGLGRFRDIAISPDGKKIYVAADSNGLLRGPTNGTATQPPNKGCILEFEYATSSVNAGPADQTSLTVYPNPADQSLTLKMDRLPDGPVMLTVYDFAGMPFYTYKINKMPNLSVELDVSSWPAGSYLLCIQAEGQAQITRKITVMRK